MAGSILKNGHPATLEPFVLYSNNYAGRGFRKNCVYSPGRFMDYLVIDEDRECDFETGNERSLRDWILAQPPNSIDPLKLFRESLKLNEGNVFNSLLTVHQLLRNEARWFSKRYYRYFSDEESANDFWSRFIDIRGDLTERGAGFEGDHRGSWYRIWGMMMFRLNLTERNRSTSDDSARTCYQSHVGVVGRNWADFKSSFTGISAELGKYLLSAVGSYRSGGDKAGKARINSAGGQTASYLINDINDRQTADPDSKECSPESYLRAEM